MRHYLHNSFFKLFTAALFAVTIFAMTPRIYAAKPSAAGLKKAPAVETAVEYEIKEGDSLGSIAQSHNISLSRLMEANDIDNPDKINFGTKLTIPSESKKKVAKKRGVRITVPKGVTLSRVAKVYEISLNSIIRANKIKNPDRLKAGQRLYIPGAQKVLVLQPPPPCYKPAVTVYRVRTDETKKLSLCYCNGKVNEKAIEELSKMSGPARKKMPFPLHPRLVKMMQKVAEHYPGKRIEIISGQRVRKHPGHESYHNKGQAMDFRVAGVSNKALVRFVRSTFSNVGVGYYPNSVFIHMDHREKKTYWVDYSRPGEKAIYGRSGMTVAEVNAIRDRRRSKDPKHISVDSLAQKISDNILKENTNS